MKLIRKKVKKLYPDYVNTFRKKYIAYATLAIFVNLLTPHLLQGKI